MQKSPFGVMKVKEMDNLWCHKGGLGQNGKFGVKVS